jgi:hypothetical protein
MRESYGLNIMEGNVTSDSVKISYSKGYTHFSIK